MADNQQNHAGDRKPDISFGSSPAGGTQRPPQPSGQMPRRAAGQPDINSMRGTARPSDKNMQQNSQPPRAARPQNTGGVRPVIRSDMPRTQGRPPQGRPPQGRPPQGRPPQQSGRPPMRSTPPLQNTMSSPEPQRSTRKVEGFGSGSTAAAATVTVRKKFSKKQALQVTGLILMLILILGLAVFLVFNHYYGFINHKAEDISNSTPMTYSDVDFSRADTFEKAVEDEKLKELTAQAKKITSDDVMNILLIGEDLRDTTKESREVGNTDVMMVISVNKKDKTITLTSIMRDCYVSFQDKDGNWWSNRINAAYWHGGIIGMKNTIEDYLSINIDRYVLVNFKVFIDIVDTLGGIDMHVTDEEANGDPDAPRSDKEHRGMQNPLDEQNKYLGNKVKTDYIKKGGDLHLNGNQALAYARLRYVGDADFDRTKRQRKVINEMIKESRSMSLVQMDQLATKVLPQVTTDVTRSELAGLLIEMLDFRNYKVQEMRIPAENTFTNEFIDGMAVLSVDFPANVELFREKAYGTTEVKVKEKSENGKALE